MSVFSHDHDNQLLHRLYIYISCCLSISLAFATQSKTRLFTVVYILSIYAWPFIRNQIDDLSNKKKKKKPWFRGVNDRNAQNCVST